MAESKSAAMFGSSRPSKGRVLVVEDEPHVRNAVRLILENAGYDVLEAPDGEKVITVAYFKKHYPQVPLEEP